MESWNEQDLITMLVSKIKTKENYLGHNEDAVAIPIDEQFIIINIDAWVESTDRPAGLSLFDSAIRAVANSLSDVYAKGAKPTGYSVSLTIPKNYQLHYHEENGDCIEGLIDGLVEASKIYDIPYQGGDVNEGKDLVIDVVAWGNTTKPIPRKTAKPGEIVCWIGPPLGFTTIALGILTKNWYGDHTKALEIYGRPNLFPHFLDINANSSIDCSDGLSRTLHQLAIASSVGIDLDGNVRIEKWTQEIAKANNIPITDLILYGGEELGIVFTCDQDTDLPEDVITLGHIIEKPGVFLSDEIIPDIGWSHFNN